MKRKESIFMELLEHYINTYLPVSRGLTEATVTSYKAVFRILLEFMLVEKGIPANKITFDLLTVETITGFLDWLEMSRSCSVSTRNHRLSVLTAFADYAQNRDLSAAAVFRSSISKVAVKKGTYRKRSFFTRDEVKIILEMPQSRKEVGIRDKTLLSFMYASGMRAQEVCDLTVADIRFYPDKAVITVHGKGRKIRCIGVPSTVAEMLKAYMKRRKICDQMDRHIFSSQTHEQMTVSCIEEIFAKYVKKAKTEYPTLFMEERYTPHSMRHTTATHMLEAGVPLFVLKNFLGHTSLQTTMIYAEISQDTVNKHLEEWNKKWFASEKDTTELNTEKGEIPGFLR